MCRTSSSQLQSTHLYHDGLDCTCDGATDYCRTSAPQEGAVWLCAYGMRTVKHHPHTVVSLWRVRRTGVWTVRHCYRFALCNAKEKNRVPFKSMLQSLVVSRAHMCSWGQEHLHEVRATATTTIVTTASPLTPRGPTPPHHRHDKLVDQRHVMSCAVGASSLCDATAQWPCICVGVQRAAVAAKQ